MEIQTCPQSFALWTYPFLFYHNLMLRLPQVKVKLEPVIFAPRSTGLQMSLWRLKRSSAHGVSCSCSWRCWACSSELGLISPVSFSAGLTLQVNTSESRSLHGCVSVQALIVNSQDNQCKCVTASSCLSMGSNDGFSGLGCPPGLQQHSEGEHLP